MSEQARARVRVRGRVQGVFFRVEARNRASSLGVSGRASNEPDGSVAAVFEGDRERVESMVDWCRCGPSGAVVDDVEVTWEEPRGDRGFDIR